ncbi:MAG: Dyrk1aINHIBITOR complex [Olpidium bornovanus]|uniref:Dyrk1aINHIBITOR complex n=1 Tax=Olpidium bornovanus TaxID=278681 RepID=A0A8H7ZYR4_9FUNG|nr:MAG: Dyrk1aINHIBITOR complex [Olpidium bornovanus]
MEAVDAATGETVAIKILPKNRESFLKQGRIEIQILEFLKAKDPNDSFNTGGERQQRHFEHDGHLCLVFEFLSIHLYEVLRSVKLAGLSLNLIRKFAWQILTALRFLCRPDVQVLHCDLKPEVQTRARSRADGHTTYIQSRFYRAPEVLLGAQLSFGIDMWSLGCILVELFTGEPLFAGRNEHDQMCRMCDVLGQPPAHVIESGDPAKVVRFFTLDADNSHRVIPTRLYEPRGRSLADIVLAKVEEAAGGPPRTYAAAAAAAAASAPKATRECGELFRDLVARMLVYDPAQRITPSDALRHRFFPATASTAANTALTGDRAPRGRPPPRSNDGAGAAGRAAKPAAQGKTGGMVG